MSRARTLADYVGGGTTVPEFDVLDGLTSTTAELNHVDGLTSAAVGINDTQTLTNKTLTSVALENASGTQNLGGTYSTERMYLNDSYTLTGDVTIQENAHLALGTIADKDVTIEANTGSTEREITGEGTLDSGNLLQDTYRTSLTGMTGELGSGVTGGSGINKLGTVTSGTLTANTMTVTGGYFFSGMQIFDSSGTWVKPAGVTAVYIIVTGSGGGGLAAGGGDRGGPGGGAGGTALKWITSGLAATEVITVAAASGDGGDGTSSSFGSHCTANGGTSGPTLNKGGEGGTTSGGDINIRGGGGAGGGGFDSKLLGSGVGGASYWGGGARAMPMGSTVDGVDGYAIGSGGGGAGSNGAGSKGHAGIVVIYEYKG
mgnify:CR=1 FL=1